MRQRLSGRAPAPPPPVRPSPGVLIGRMIFVGGLVLALLGLGFLVMLGFAAGSVLAGLIFGAALVAGLVISGLAVRDLTGPATEQAALVTDKGKHTEGGNPNYELKLRFVNQTLKDTERKVSYNVTQRDWERFEVGDRVAVRYSAHFKLLVDIRLLSRSA